MQIKNNKNNVQQCLSELKSVEQIERNRKLKDSNLF